MYSNDIEKFINANKPMQTYDNIVTLSPKPLEQAIYILCTVRYILCYRSFHDIHQIVSHRISSIRLAYLML